MKQILRPGLAVVAVIAAFGVTGVALAQAKPKAPAASAAAAAPASVDKAKASQVLGYNLASQYPEWARDMIDPQQVGQAVTRALQGQKPTLSEPELEATAKAFGAEVQARAKQRFDELAATNKREGDAYLAKNKTQPGVKVTADGLQYQVITQGTGPKPTANDTVQVNYSGSFVNNEIFDSSSRQGGGPAKISLANVFPGFREAVMMMPVGSQYRFVIPSDLAYGAMPQNNSFPPNATLIFDVTLVKIGD